MPSLIFRAISIGLAAMTLIAPPGALARKSKKAEGTIAFEMEATSKEIYKKKYGPGESWHALKANWDPMDAWGRMIQERCERNKRYGCSAEKIFKPFWYEGKEVTDRHYGWRISYENGLTFDLTVDPGVIEIKVMSTESIVSTRRSRAILRRDLFGPMKELGLSARLPFLEAHRNTGIASNFGTDNLRKITNKLKDDFNHQEFSWLFMGGTFENLPPLSLLRMDRYPQLAEVFEKVDSGEIQDEVELGKQIREKVYDITFNRRFEKDYLQDKSEDPPSKYQANNVQTLDEDVPPEQRRLENRASYNPKDEDDLIDLFKLEAARNRYLNSHRGRIKLKRFNPHATWATTVAHFRLYVQESRLPWSRYKRFVPARFRNLELPKLPPTEWENVPLVAPECALRNIRTLLGPIVKEGP